MFCRRGGIFVGIFSIWWRVNDGWDEDESEEEEKNGSGQRQKCNCHRFVFRLHANVMFTRASILMQWPWNENLMTIIRVREMFINVNCWAAAVTTYIYIGIGKILFWYFKQDDEIQYIIYRTSCLFVVDDFFCWYFDDNRRFIYYFKNILIVIQMRLCDAIRKRNLVDRIS